MKKINEHKKNICKSSLYVKLFSLICDVPYDHIWYIVTLANSPRDMYGPVVKQQTQTYNHRKGTS